MIYRENLLPYSSLNCGLQPGNKEWLCTRLQYLYTFVGGKVLPIIIIN